MKKSKIVVIGGCGTVGSLMARILKDNGDDVTVSDLSSDSPQVEILKEEGINLFISGHSHILKIQFDQKLDCLHINPGAAGNQGWHLVRTIVRFTIDGTNIQNCEVIELGKRGL